VSTKTLENQTFLSSWLDEGAPGRSLAAFRSCIAPSGGDGVCTGCDWAAKMGIPDGTGQERRFGIGSGDVGCRAVEHYVLLGALQGSARQGEFEGDGEAQAHRAERSRWAVVRFATEHQFPRIERRAFRCRDGDEYRATTN
jgi:hypothetical protein